MSSPPVQLALQSAVRLISVSKRYPNGDNPNDALREISLTLPQGSFTAVMGPSGSGKTTLLNIAAGLDSPSEGRIFVGGQDISSLSADNLTRFRRENIGFVFQSFNLIEHLSVAANIELPVLLAGKSPDRACQDYLIDRVGLRGLQDRLPGQLSGGQAQRAAIARALFTRPAILFADEPTGALDSNTASAVLTLLADTARELQQTVVLVTHDPWVASTADRVLFLADGRITDALSSPSVDQITRRTIRSVR